MHVGPLERGMYPRGDCPCASGSTSVSSAPVLMHWATLGLREPEQGFSCHLPVGDLGRLSPLPPRPAL